MNLHESTIYISIYIVYSFSISKWPIEMNIDYIYSVPVAVSYHHFPEECNVGEDAIKPWLEVTSDIDLVTKAVALSCGSGKSLEWGAFGRLELPIDFRSLKPWWKGLRETLRAAIFFF